MKPICFKVPVSGRESIRIEEYEGEHFYDKLHYHSKYQITAVIKGQGIFYGGNNMVQFNAGDVFFIGENIPHLIKDSETTGNDLKCGVKCISIFFDIDSLGKTFFNLPELSSIQNIFKKSKRVIKIDGSISSNIYKQILSLKTLSEFNVILSFLQLLDNINNAATHFVNDEMYNLSIDERVGQRLNNILAFTFKHIDEQVKIDDVASIAHLSRSQFSRYFKRHTGKTYIQFLNELRIESACVMLVNEEYTIERICYAVGFQNLSNFNRQFRKLNGLSPSDFRKKRQV